MSQVRHSKASLLPVVTLLLAILFAPFDAEARREGPGPKAVHQRTHIYFKWSNFFDPEYAQWAVKNVKSFAELDNGFDAEFQKWEKESVGRSYQASMEALERHSNKEGIKRAHDNQHLWNWWVFNLARLSRPSENPNIPWNGWNKWPEKQCTWIKRTLRNPWGPDSCEIPDWRSPEMIAEDEAFLSTAASGAVKN